MIRDTKFPELKREILFPTPIYFKELQGTKELNKQLFKDIKSWMKKDPEGVEKTNVNGWHSQTNQNQKPEYQPLIKQMFTMVEQIFQDMGYQPRIALGNMWSNVNYPGGFNRHHVHPNSTISGIYYVKIPTDAVESCLWVEDPRPGPNLLIPRSVKKLPRELWRVVQYPPKEGMATLFPSWLPHGVEVNRSKLKKEKGWRVSVAFNFIQVANV
jgi:uncharacterized protein (TIGR02466 family)